MGSDHSRSADRLALAAAAVTVGAVTTVARAETEGASQLGDLGQAITALLIFGVLVLVLGKWAWKPVIAQLKRREQEIAEQLKDSERRENEAKDLEAQYRARMERAEAEAKQILAESLEEAARAREEMLAAARDEGGKSIEAAKAEIEQFKKAALEDLQQAMAGLAVDIAGEIIREELSAKSHERLLAQSLERIRNRAGGQTG